MKNEDLLSIIIITWNSEAYIEECINSVIEDAENTKIPYEIIVVDNGSVDRTQQILEELASKHRFINCVKLDRNTGTTFSRNLAIKKSKGDYLFFLDSDEVVLPGAIKTLLETLKANKNIGIAAPRVVLKDCSIQFSVRKFPTAFTKFFKNVPIERLRDLAEASELYSPSVYSYGFKELMEVDVAAACGWMVPRVAINNIGLLDERIFYSPEDVDYCVRMWLNGWKVVYVPFAEVFHYSQKLTYKSFKFLVLHTFGLFYYFSKYKYFFKRDKLYHQIGKYNSI